MGPPAGPVSWPVSWLGCKGTWLVLGGPIHALAAVGIKFVTGKAM